MAYLGKSPSQGVRNRYYFTASGSETSISGALTGGTLTFTDGNYVDVILNGVTLVAGTDYNTSTANTIAGLSALTASDVVEIVVYDVFSVFSGNVNSDFSIGGNLSVTGTTALTGNATTSGTASIAGHASIGVDAVASTRALTVAGATDGSSSTILQLYNSSLASKFSVRDDGFVSIAGNMEIATAANDVQLTLKSTDADANVGPIIDMIRDSASPADGDELGRIRFKGDDDAGNDTTYAYLQVKINDATEASGDGELEIFTRQNASGRSRIKFGFDSTQAETVFNEGSQDIDFRVESDSNANMLFVDAGNDKIGIGTNSGSGSGQVTIRGAGSTRQLVITDDDVERLQIYHVGNDSTIESSSSGSNSTNLIFKTSSSGTEAERVRISSGGRVGIGQSSPAGRLDVNNNGATTETIMILSDFGGTGAHTQISFNNTNGQVGTINTSGSATAFNTSSDYRLKENVEYSWDATSRLKQLKPARFNFIADADTTVDGFLAHEVSSIVPESVTGTKDETRNVINAVLLSDGKLLAENITQDDWTAGKLATTDSDGNTVDALYPSDSTWTASHTEPVMQGIDQSKLVPLLVKTIIELEARIATLEAE